MLRYRRPSNTVVDEMKITTTKIYDATKTGMYGETKTRRLI